MINLRFVVTGGPGAGKTTTLEVLSARGFRSVPESARAIIKKRKESGLSPRPAPEQFGAEILKEDLARYRETAVHNKPVFFDRGACDALGLLYACGGLSLTEVATYVREFRYNDIVFLFPPWREIYRKDAERDQSFEEAITVCESLRQWYRQWCYQLVEVPPGNVEQRADFILQTIDYWDTNNERGKVGGKVECSALFR